MKKTNTKSADITVEFRTGFSKRLQNCPEALKENIEKIFNSFISCPDDGNCFDYLWELTHAPEKALQNWGLDLQLDDDSAGDTGNAISMEMVSAMKNELRYQRTLRHPDFMKFDIPDSCRDDFKRLSSASDAIIAVKVFCTCQERCICSCEEDIERILFLTSSAKEENIFGGIRSLHFGKSEATALKSFATQIHDLLEALWTEELARRQSTVNTPLAAQLASWEATPDVDTENVDYPKSSECYKEIPEGTPNKEIPENEKPEADPEFIPNKEITAVNITADEDLFEQFQSAYKALENAGYDVSKVVSKMDAIAKILEVSKILNS